MASVMIGIGFDDVPSAKRMALPDGGAFISIRFGADVWCNVVGSQASQRARQLAADLIHAADAIDADTPSPRGPMSETALDRSAAADVENGSSAGAATDGHESAAQSSEAVG